jgi:hypothetical protein
MAQSAAQSQKPLALENFTERLSTDVPVSGRILVGAIVRPDQTRSASASLTPRLLWRPTAIKPAIEPLCVTFASRDGQYYGEGILSVATLNRLTDTVPVEGKHTPSTLEHLRKLESDQLAVLASAGDCRLGASGGKTTIHLLDPAETGAAALPRSAAGQFTVLLMLNSMTYAVAIEASIPGVGTRPAACRVLGDGQRNKAFNTVCELAVPTAAAEAELTIHRRRYERRFDPIRFNMAWSSR